MPDREITEDSWSRGCGPHPDRELVRRLILHAEDGAATTARLDEALDLIAASMAADRRIEHLLAGALGYRTYGEGGPGSPGEYATGEHTAETLAMEAARKLSSVAGDRGCSCDSWPYYDGPHVDCDVHGSPSEAFAAGEQRAWEKSKELMDRAFAGRGHHRHRV